jgi:MFS family permease
LLTAGPGWRWVLFVNVPIAIVLVLGLRAKLAAHPRPTVRGRLDLLGAGLATTATGTLIYGVIRAGDRGWDTTATAALMGLAAVLYLAFALRQRLAARPLLDLGLLARRPVATGTLLILVATALMISVFFLGSFYFQDHRGYGALHTGLLFLPVALAAMAGADVAGRVIGSVGGRALGVAGLLVGAFGMGIPGFVDGPGAMVIGISIAGAGSGAVFVVASTSALAEIDPRQAGLASGILSTFHEFGASLGAAVASSMAAASLAGESADGFARGYTTGAVVAVAAALVVLVVTPGRRPARRSSSSGRPVTAETSQR